MKTEALNALFDLPRPVKRSLQVLTDAVLLAFSFAMAMLLRTESLDFASDLRVWAAVGAALPVSILLFVKLGFYRAVIRYMGARAIYTILTGLSASAAALAAMVAWFDLPVPGSVPVLYALLALCTVGGVRFALRALYNRSQQRLKTRVIIYGAGQSGRQLAHSLFQGQDHAPVAFVDDAKELHGSQIAGLAVFAPDQIERLIDEYNVKAILLAMPSASRAVRQAILARLETLPVRVQTIPGMADLVSGHAQISEVREVTVEDLLGRDPVPPSPALMSANVAGKSVMVTGAGGSIGSELCRQILRQDPRVLLLLELCEYALYEIERELSATIAAEGRATRLVPVLGSVRDGAACEAVMRRHAVQTIYHAAAYKHVPIVETNPIEGVRNNVFGTLAVARAAVAAGVESFILVSTDKAVRPTNVMGATKRLAEVICLALSQRPGRTRFSMVRFGNVLGSSGSVIPLFRRQIAEGGPVTVTHPDITRYFMTITEAAQLVIQAGAMGRGGDVFLLDMGRPVRIVDLAQRMIRLSGFNPVLIDEPGRPLRPQERGGDSIPVVFTRLRNGEKLHEELLIEEGARPTRHPRILTAQEQAADWSRLAPLLDNLREACDAGDALRVRGLLASGPIGFVPTPADLPAEPAVARTGESPTDRREPATGLVPAAAGTGP
ncbi:MAG: polysaccharide biosynthesis protein [Gemmobacter sp.]